MNLSSRDIFPEDELEWLGLQITDETMGVMIDKKIHLYNIKGDPDAFISNYDIVENKVLPAGIWIVFRHVGKRTSQLYFTEEMLKAQIKPVKWLLQMIQLFQKISSS